MDNGMIINLEERRPKKDKDILMDCVESVGSLENGVVINRLWVGDEYVHGTYLEMLNNGREF